MAFPSGMRKEIPEGKIRSRSQVQKGDSHTSCIQSNASSGSQQGCTTLERTCQPASLLIEGQPHGVLARCWLLAGRCSANAGCDDGVWPQGHSAKHKAGLRQKTDRMCSGKQVEICNLFHWERFLHTWQPCREPREDGTTLTGALGLCGYVARGCHGLNNHLLPEKPAASEATCMKKQAPSCSACRLQQAV